MNAVNGTLRTHEKRRIEEVSQRLSLARHATKDAHAASIEH